MDLPKRSEIKKLYREEKSDSPMELFVFEKFSQRGLRFDKQLKVGCFFADLAMPELMISIEYDGQEYHKDKEKDINRIKYFNERGWKVFSIEKIGIMFQLSENGKFILSSSKLDDIVNMVEEEIILKGYRLGVDVKNRRNKSDKGFQKIVSGFGNFYERFENCQNGYEKK